MQAVPTLSICIPTYNRCERLDRLVGSLVTQIRKDPELEENIQLLISDNCSTDDTREICEKWAKEAPFISYFRNTWNIGGDINQIRSVELATGHYAWIIGDDDLVRDGGVAKVFSKLNPEKKQLFLDFACMDLNGDCLASTRLHADIKEPITTVGLMKRLGYLSIFGFISCHVFDREKFLAAEPMKLVRKFPWYILNTTLLIAFHDQPCLLIRGPVLEYQAGNDRLPGETAMYVRVFGVLRSLEVLESGGYIDSDFLYGCYETGAGALATIRNPHYFREELFGNLAEISLYWALPGRADWQLILNFIDRGPGFWGIRNHLKSFYHKDFTVFTNYQKPIIHYWHGKAWFPGFSILLSSDVPEECGNFDRLMKTWPEQFAHESILISRLDPEKVTFENLDVFMAPFEPHRSPGASLNSGFRKVLAAHALILDKTDSPALPALIDLIDKWDSHQSAPESCLLFESGSDGPSGFPTGLLGLYLKADDFIRLGAFENQFDSWSRRRLLVDAAFRLKSEAWTVNGERISTEIMHRWYENELPGWLRLLRALRHRPITEHGLNITRRYHLGRK
jgi:glycosyltransferase involved in cell wall biosynthesis